jgi:flagellar biosynthesis GTPase FlhF
MWQRTKIVALLALGVMVGLCVGLLAQGALGALGVGETDARNALVSSLSRGYVPVYMAAKAFKAAPPATRATMVRTAISWARAYTESAAFKADYARKREADAPQPPRFKGTVDEELAAQRAERLKSVEDARRNIASMPANLRPQMETMVKQMEEQNTKMDKDSQMQAMLRQAIEMQRSNDQKAYEQSVQQHEKRFPADPRTLIARRLQEFLDVSQDVDFTARLVPAGSRQRFADTRYEAKPDQWKLCYRAGREAVTSARETARAWLGSLK